MFYNLIALYQVMHDVKFPRKSLNNLIYKRLKAVLVSAYQHVPYYREVMQSVGYDPTKDYSGPEDISILPITTKETIKKIGIKAFLREGIDLNRCFSEDTSGCSGIPLTVYRGHYERAVQIAKWLRVLSVNGYSVWHKVMSLSPPWRLKEGRSIVQKFGILRRLAVNYHNSPKMMVDIFLAYKPDVLYGNRTHLDLVALELRRRGIQHRGLKILLGGAEVIHEANRQMYRQHFGVELTETYGSAEMGVMFYETPKHNGLYLSEDLTYFEFLDKAGKPVPPGEPGRVVVTDLMGKIMPFIRYDQGDIVTFEYADGIRHNDYRIITQIIGREDDKAVLPDGTQVSFHVFYEVMDQYSDIFQFRILQRTRSLFQILVVANSEYLRNIKDDMIQNLQERFPPSIKFDIRNVDRIEADPSGKIRMLISEVE